MLKLPARNGKNVIFDVIRRRYVALTPEEWVRQHFVHFLLAHKGYPQALMANEVQVQLNSTKKRCDTVLYRRDLTARMIVEYKAPDIEITQKVFDQITRYNMVLKVDYLIVSNGLQHYCCRMDYEHNTYIFLHDIPGVSKPIALNVFLARTKSFSLPYRKAITPGYIPSKHPDVLYENTRMLSLKTSPCFTA